jgi:hypothetical protein
MERGECGYKFLILIEAGVGRRLDLIRLRSDPVVLSRLSRPVWLQSGCSGSKSPDCKFYSSRITKATSSGRPGEAPYKVYPPRFHIFGLKGGRASRRQDSCSQLHNDRRTPPTASGCLRFGLFRTKCRQASPLASACHRYIT